MYLGSVGVIRYTAFLYFQVKHTPITGKKKEKEKAPTVCNLRIFYLCKNQTYMWKTQLGDST